MHVHRRLGEVDGQDLLEHRGELRYAARRRASTLRCLREVPVGEQVEFALQQRAVVGRQFVRLAGELDLDQRIDGGAVERVGVGVGQVGEVGGRAEVGEQQEAAFEVGGEHLGHVHAGVVEQLLHVQPGPDVLVAGRRVHDDAGLCHRRSVARK